ncbi:hypothetical protein [Thermomonas paludicola]|uniref:hypothetical protein n=1 Tax=Thermomonas paludicola TaxID=2884874 RepID=UPI0021159BA4|nr:hypothetical protein [Thermomonas paludicola]
MKNVIAPALGIHARQLSRNKSTMHSTSFELARRYLIDDLDASIEADSHLHKILEARTKNKSCTEDEITYLRSNELHALAGLIKGDVSWAQYKQAAAIERERRVALIREAEAEAKRVRDEARRLKQEELERKRQLRLEAQTKEAALLAQREAERIAYLSSPEYIAQQKEQAILRKYGVASPPKEQDRQQFWGIFEKLESNTRLEGADAAWLIGMKGRYGLEGAIAAHHRLEADFCIAEFKRTSDPWQAVNASGHLRKCNAAKEANELLATLHPNRLKHPKLHSAVLTTHGGAKRDLGNLDAAQSMGEKAHALQRENFRPCTLLGAVHIEQRNYELGHEWYRKAEERGATSGSIQAEIQTLLKNMTGKEREAAIKELLRIDRERYGWLASVQKQQ